LTTFSQNTCRKEICSPPSGTSARSCWNRIGTARPQGNPPLPARAARPAGFHPSGIRAIEAENLHDAEDKALHSPEVDWDSDSDVEVTNVVELDARGET
jgi:hypothetical protein